MKIPVISETSLQDLRVILKFNISKSIEYFEGHFPGHPVLPGVVQLAWAVQFAKEYFKHGLRCKNVEVLKFHDVIVPGTNITLMLEYKKETGKVYFQYESEKSKHSSGRLVLE